MTPQDTNSVRIVPVRHPKASDRFKLVTKNPGGYGVKYFHMAFCGEPGCRKSAFVRTAPNSPLPDEVVAKKITQLGWAVGKRAKDDRCPFHARPTRPAKPDPEVVQAVGELLETIDAQQTPEPVAEEPQVSGGEAAAPEASTPPPAAEAEAVGVDAPAPAEAVHVEDTGPGDQVDLRVADGQGGADTGAGGGRDALLTTPTRAQNRTMLNALDKYYDETHHRYWGDYTDRKLADQLNLPRVWIAEVRERFYGPDVNEKTQVRDQELGLMEAKLRRAMEDAMAMAERCETLANEVAQMRRSVK